MIFYTNKELLGHLEKIINKKGKIRTEEIWLHSAWHHVLHTAGLWCLHLSNVASAPTRNYWSAGLYVSTSHPEMLYRQFCSLSKRWEIHQVLLSPVFKFKLMGGRMGKEKAWRYLPVFFFVTCIWIVGILGYLELLHFSSSPSLLLNLLVTTGRKNSIVYHLWSMSKTCYLKLQASYKNSCKY